MVLERAISLDASDMVTNSETMHFPFNAETELVCLAFHDGENLSGLDSRYNLRNHACTYFCNYCQVDDQNKLSEYGTSHTTTYNINCNADLHLHAPANLTNANQTAFQISEGVGGRPGDPYPAASRITPPLLLLDMETMTKFSAVHNDHINSSTSTANTAYKQLHQQKLK